MSESGTKAVVIGARSKIQSETRCLLGEKVASATRGFCPQSLLGGGTSAVFSGRL